MFFFRERFSQLYKIFCVAVYFNRSYFLTLRKNVIKITNPFHTIDRFTGFRKKEGSSGLLGKLQNWKNFNCSSYRYIVKYCPHQLINNLNYIEFPTKSSMYFHSITKFFIWKNLDVLYHRKFCALFYKNWPIGFCK